MADDIETKVIQLIANELGWWRNCPKVDLTDSFEKLGADSLDCLSLTMTFEEEFDIQFSDQEAADMRTVEQAVAMVRGKLGTPHTNGELFSRATASPDYSGGA